MDPKHYPQPVTPPVPPPISPSTQPGPPPDNSQPTIKPRIPGIVYAGFILAFLVPLAGLVVSIIAQRKVSKQSLPGKGLAMAGTIIGGIFTTIGLILFGFGLFLFIALGGLHTIGGNNAEKAGQIFTDQLVQMGGKKICSNGDTGYGPDNNTPWYEVYYQIPDSNDLTNKIEGIAAGQGYKLQADTQTTQQLQESSLYASPGDEQFNPKTDYLTGKNGNKTLTVQINRDTDVSLKCNSGQYGRKQAASNGTAILDISFSLPATNVTSTAPSN